MPVAEWGCSIPQPLAELISRHYNDSEEDFRKAGIEYTIRQVYEYMSLGIGGLHFFTLNKAEAILDICEGCGIAYRNKAVPPGAAVTCKQAERAGNTRN